MKVYNLHKGTWASNCYILADEESRSACVIDPSENADRIVDALKQKDLTLKYILLTHGHFDHMFFLEELRAKTHALFAMHKDDVECLTDAEKSAFNLINQSRKYLPPDIELSDGDELDFANEKIKVFHTPGHTKGSSCYAVGDIMFTGDTLFVDGYGRCDLYGGDFRQMRLSLNRLAALPKDYKIYPGHGGTGSLKKELCSDEGIITNYNIKLEN